MSMLFYVDERSGVVLRPECVKLCPELAGLKQEELLFIILAYDYHSPYRQFPEHDRVRKAMLHAFDDVEQGLTERMSIKLAITAYKSLQYDSKIELVRKYQKKIEALSDQMDEDDSPSSIEKITKAIDVLRKNILGLEQEISTAITNKGQIKGDMELSFIEEMMSNKKYYESVIAKNEKK